MVRDAMYITVPSYFRCPISMDVMKSPVSLCTGVTYDRSSIQHWLESGHDTCPATNQSLPSKDFVPNLTLHRLINLWSVPSSLSRDEVTCLVGAVATRSEDWRRSLSRIADFAGSGGDSRKFLADSDGFVAAIASILRDHRDETEIEIAETAVKILDLILPESGVVEKLKKSIDLSSILAILRRGSARSKAGSARIVEAISVSIGSESKRDAVAVLASALRSSADPEVDEAAMSCLISLSAASGSIKSALASAGLVEMVAERLESGGSVKLGLRLVREMATVAEGRAAMGGDGGRCVAAAVERMMESPEDAVAAVWAMCCVYGDGRVKEAARRSNGVTKVLLVMQTCNGDGRLRRMCRELLKVLGSSGFGSSVLGSYHTKTAHIMPY